VNPTDTTITGNVEFLGQGDGANSAQPVVLSIEGVGAGSSFPYSIPPRSFRRFVTSSPVGQVNVGSVRATPTGATALPSGLVIFSYQTGGITVSEAGVSALPTSTAFRLYAETAGVPGNIGSVRSGVAITNTVNAVSTVAVDVTNLQGNSIGPPVFISIPPMGQTASFLDELMALPAGFKGIVRLTAPPAIAVIGLRGRVNQRGDFLITTTTPSDENAAPILTESYLPHFADGGGWSTQFILYPGTPGQGTSGTFQFMSPEGEEVGLEF
jgi:hypothetical protein